MAKDDEGKKDRAENLQLSFTAYRNSLTIFSVESDPFRWAAAQRGIGTAWAEFISDLPERARPQYYQNAIGAFHAAATVDSRTAYPLFWAQIQTALGQLWLSEYSDFPSPADAFINSIACLQGTLTVYTQADFPEQHDAINSELDQLRRAYEKTSIATTRPYDLVEPAQ